MILPEIKKRRSIRTYQKQALKENDLKEIIYAAQLAPTAKNNRAVEFIIIRDEDLQLKIHEIIGQEMIKDAPVLIVPVTNIKKTPWPVQDLSLASAFMFLQATHLGLGSVWKNIDTVEFRERLQAILQLPDDFTFINLIAIGYPVTPLPEHTEAELGERRLHWEKW